MLQFLFINCQHNLHTGTNESVFLNDFWPGLRTLLLMTQLTTQTFSMQKPPWQRDILTTLTAIWCWASSPWHVVLRPVSMFSCSTVYLIQKNSNIVKYYYNLIPVFYLNIFFKCIIPVMKSWIFSIIIPVFSVTWSFRNHFNMLICCSRNISHYITYNSKVSGCIQFILATFK